MKKNKKTSESKTWSLRFHRAANGPNQAAMVKKGEKTIRCVSADPDPINNIIRVIKRLTKTRGKLIYFSLQPMLRDGSLSYRATMIVSFLGHNEVMLGQSNGANIIKVSALAYLDAVNQRLSDPEKNRG